MDEIKDASAIVGVYDMLRKGCSRFGFKDGDESSVVSWFPGSMRVLRLRREKNSAALQVKFKYLVTRNTSNKAAAGLRKE